MSRRLVAGLLASVSLGACVLTTDLDGFHDPKGGDAGSDATTPTVVGDGSNETLTDAESGGGDSGVEAGTVDPSVIFQDDFNRADGPVGNGWIDHQSRYPIVSQQIPVSGNDYGFQNAYLYRPKSDELDIKASIEFVTLQPLPSYPQVHIRAIPGDNYKCYGIGVPKVDNSFFFGRCGPGGAFVSYGDQPLTENLLIGKTYRLSISAQGTDPVHLVMLLEKKTESGFVVIGKKEFDDTAPERLKQPGMFGIAADTEPNWVYDNFVATKVTN